MPRPSSSRSVRKPQASAAKSRPGLPGRRAASVAQEQPASDVASLLKRVLHLFRDALEEALRPYGITAAQLHVLSILDREPGLSGAKLARLCAVTPQTMQALIATVESNGWIRRKHHPENERILLATLTPTGQRLLFRCRHSVCAIQERMLHDLPAADVRALKSLLEQCAANLKPIGAS